MRKAIIYWDFQQAMPELTQNGLAQFGLFLSIPIMREKG